MTPHLPPPVCRIKSGAATPLLYGWRDSVVGGEGGRGSRAFWFIWFILISKPLFAAALVSLAAGESMNKGSPPGSYGSYCRIMLPPNSRLRSGRHIYPCAPCNSTRSGSMTTNIKIHDDVWKELNARKNPGESFNDVLVRMLEDTEQEVEAQ